MLAALGLLLALAWRTWQIALVSKKIRAEMPRGRTLRVTPAALVGQMGQLLLLPWCIWHLQLLI